MHSFLSAMMLSQCCRLFFWRCLFVVRVDFVLGLSGCDELLVLDLPFVVVFDSRF